MSGEIADLADRMAAKHRRSEDLEFEFEIEWGALTGDERDDYMALLNQRIAHGEEGLEGIIDTNRALKAVFVLVVCNGGGTVGEALVEGRITVRDVVEAIRGAVPDPLAE